MTPDAIIGHVPPQRTRSRQKALGQNFLADRSVARRIVEEFHPRAGDFVLEVGPGEGALTDLLAGRVAGLVAVEIDPELARLLTQRFADREDVVLVQGDILETDVDLLPFAGEGPVRVLSNLPYSVSTAVIRKLLSWPRVTDLTIMVQKEVADRIEAPASSPDRGYLSVLCQLHCRRLRRVLRVGPGAFRPPPKVESAVLSLDVRPHAERVADDVEGVLRLVSAGFVHRRKTLYNNLRPVTRLDPDLWAAVCDRAGIQEQARAEALDLRDWIALRDVLHDSPGSVCP